MRRRDVDVGIANEALHQALLGWPISKDIAHAVSASHATDAINYLSTKGDQIERLFNRLGLCGRAKDALRTTQ